MLKRALLISCSIVFASSFTISAYGQQDDVSATDIIKKLGRKSNTRSIAVEAPKMSDDDAAFIDTLKNKGTRSIDVVERKKITEVIEASALPTIDLEIYFDYDSATISDESIPALEQLDTALASYELKDSVFLVGGHTDAKGSDEYNQHLSEQRAFAVKQYLEEHYNLPSGELVAAGFGEEKLKNDNDPEAAENRRVQIVRLTQ